MSTLAIWNLLGPAHVEDGAAQSLGSRRVRAVWRLARRSAPSVNSRSRENLLKAKRGNQKRLKVQMRRFNSSGAITRDDIMYEGANAPRIKGKSAWKQWLPESIQRAAFSQGTGRQVAGGLSRGRRQRGVGLRHVQVCKRFVAHAILDGL